MTNSPFDEDGDLVGEYEPPRASRVRRSVRINVVLVVVVAMIVLAGSAGRRPAPSGPDPTQPPEVGRIAVVGEDGSLATVDSEGGSRVVFDVADVGFIFPAWSPDGGRIAALGQGVGSGGLYVFEATADRAPDPIVVYESPDRQPFYLYWSPDGERIAFLTGGNGIALRIAGSTGGIDAETVLDGEPMYWDWIGADRLIVHSGLVGDDAFVGETDLAGASLEEARIAPGYFRAPVVSADGRYRAFVRDSGGGTVGDVVIESRAGAEVSSVRHATTIFGLAAIGFSPDGDLLAFIGPDRRLARAPNLPVGPLRVVDAADGLVRTLLDGTVFAFFWSPDGRTITAFRQELPGGGGGVASLGGAVVAAGSASTDAGPRARLAAGVDLGLVFVDASTGDVRSELTIRLGDAFVDQLLPFFDQYALSHRIWAPDSGSVVLPLVGSDDVTRLVVLPADGSAARTIADGIMGFWSP